MCTGSTFSSADDANPCANYGTPNCPAGQGLAGGTASTDKNCQPCGSGKYSTATDSSACTDNTCPTGEFLSSPADQPQTCSTACVAGKYKDGGCIDCKSGTYVSTKNITINLTLVEMNASE